MPYDPRLHHRRSIRLKHYDYSAAGPYFVTVVTWQREWLFGEIVNDEMHLNQFGQIVAGGLYRLPDVNTWVVMPNHIHFIYVIDYQNDQKDHRSEGVLNPKPPLPVLIQNYKSVTTRQINNRRNSPAAAVWQRNYYEHVIRSWNELTRVSDYILDNPRQWAEDPENIH